MARQRHLSIPELPANAVDREHPRHLEPRYDLVRIRQDIALLIADDRPHDPNFQQRRKCFCRQYFDIGSAKRKKISTAVFVNSGESQLEVSRRKPARKRAREVDLRAALELWPIRYLRLPSRDERIDPETPCKRSSDRADDPVRSAERDRLKCCVIDYRRRHQRVVQSHSAKRDPRAEKLDADFPSRRAAARERGVIRPRSRLPDRS